MAKGVKHFTPENAPASLFENGLAYYIKELPIAEICTKSPAFEGPGKVIQFFDYTAKANTVWGYVVCDYVIDKTSWGTCGKPVAPPSTTSSQEFGAVFSHYSTNSYEAKNTFFAAYVPRKTIPWQSMPPMWKNVFQYNPSFICASHAKTLKILLNIGAHRFTKLDKAEANYYSSLNRLQAINDAIGRTYEWWKLTTGHTPSNIPSVIYSEERLGLRSEIELRGTDLEEAIADLRKMRSTEITTSKRMHTLLRKAELQEKSKKKKKGKEVTK